jgi:hypothetical protein
MRTVGPRRSVEVETLNSNVDRSFAMERPRDHCRSARRPAAGYGAIGGLRGALADHDLGNYKGFATDGGRAINLPDRGRRACAARRQISSCTGIRN